MLVMESCNLELTYRKPQTAKNFKIGDRVHRLYFENPKSPFRYWSGTITDTCKDYFFMKEDAGGNVWVKEYEIDFLPTKRFPL